MDELWAGLDAALGLDAEALTFWQMAVRAVIVYLAALALVRVGEKRFLGKHTAFDVILGIILGSVLSRAINGSAAFFETLGAGLVLVGLHWLFAVMAFHSDRLGTLFKGNERILIRDGEIQWDAMAKSHISEGDLLGALRANARVTDPKQVKIAYLERSGDISAISRDSKPEIVEVDVQAGVQTVRIEIG